jgi:hypothetical protein
MINKTLFLNSRAGFCTFYPPSQKTMGLPMDECTKSYGVISPRTMGG